MTNPLEKFLQQAGSKSGAFPVNSRYYGIETASTQNSAGETVVYIRRRLVPQPDSFALLQEHTVTEGDRLDNITYKYYGDPEQFWRICDANGVLDPDELTGTPGKSVRITLPLGIPVIKNA